MLAVLPRFREENTEIEHWLPVSFPKEPDKAIVYPDPFDCARFGMDFEHAPSCDHGWCGACVMTLGANANVAAILSGLGGGLDPVHADSP